VWGSRAICLGFSFGGWISVEESLRGTLHPGVYYDCLEHFVSHAGEILQHFPEKLLFLRMVVIGLRGRRE